MTEQTFRSSRRELFIGAGAGMIVAGLPSIAVRAATASVLPRNAKPLPLADVRLSPSAFLDAVEANRRYLMQLEPDRLLHNFRKFAGLESEGRTLWRMGSRHDRGPHARPLPDGARIAPRADRRSRSAPARALYRR